MGHFKLRLCSQSLWYVLWTAMALISAASIFADHLRSYANLVLVVTVALASMAFASIAAGLRFLTKKESKLSSVVVIVFAVAQLVQWIHTMAPPSPYRGVDFSAYYLAAKVLSEMPNQSLYDLPLYQDGRMNLNVEAPPASNWHTAALRFHVPWSAPFIYPPFFAVLVKPLAHVSFARGYLIWEILSIVFLIAAMLLILNLGGARFSHKAALILGVGIFSYFPLQEGLFLGQTGCFIAFLIATGVWLLAKNYTSLSAMSFAVATLTKLTPIIAVPLLIIHRRWRWLAAYVGWMAILLIVSASQSGWTAYRIFWHKVLPAVSCGAPVAQNSSIVASVQEILSWYVPSSPKAPATIPQYACTASRCATMMVYFLMLIRFYLRRHDGNLVRDLMLMVLLGIPLSPIAWWHHYTIALIPFVYLWSVMTEKGDRILLILFLVVATNIGGFALLLIRNTFVQLTLAAIPSFLTIALVYLKLGAGKEVAAHPAL
jgi:hypothetical protein